MSFENLINDIADKAEKNNTQDTSDYVGENGLLYCGKCNTPKQCKVELFGVERVVYCLCKCKADALEQERVAELQREKYLHVLKLRRLGFPDSEMSRWTFEKDDGGNEEISRVAHNYVDKFDEMKKRGKGLLFFGSVGTGKTFISACIANALIDKGRACLVTNFARLVNTIQGLFDGRQDYIDSLNDFDLLIIDDLASERDTEYMSEIVQNIIDSRYRAGLPLIITTNLTSEELKHPKEIRKQRIYSRLFEMCVPIEVKGIDRRKKMLVKEYDEMAEMLGLKVADCNEK